MRTWIATWLDPPNPMYHSYYYFYTFSVFEQRTTDMQKSKIKPEKVNVCEREEANLQLVTFPTSSWSCSCPETREAI